MKKQRSSESISRAEKYDTDDIVHVLKDVVNVLYLLLKRVEGISHQIYSLHEFLKNPKEKTAL